MSNGINMTTKSVKAINFDIKQELLDRYYEKSNSMAYYDINKFLKDRGFEHRQGSGYISKDAMTVNDVLSIIYDMNEELPWTLICIDLKDIILEIKTECESQDIERQVEKYIAQSLDEDIEKDRELDDDLEI